MSRISWERRARDGRDKAAPTSAAAKLNTALYSDAAAKKVDARCGRTRPHAGVGGEKASEDRAEGRITKGGVARGSKLVESGYFLACVPRYLRAGL